MAGKRTNQTPAFKVQVALAALQGDRTVNELAGHFGVHPTLIHGWKKHLRTGAEGLFVPGAKAAATAQDHQDELYEQIGRLKMELEWLGKKSPPSADAKRQLIDITYVPLAAGFLYLAATIDWYSRYVIAWRLSNTLDGAFCLDMLAEALGNGRPEVFNTDQGVQFTAQAWAGRLESAGVQVSMDGRGRCLDTVFVERLWRSVQDEDVDLRGDEAVPDLERGLGRYFGFYNHERFHQALGYRTPAAVYGERNKTG